MLFNVWNIKPYLDSWSNFKHSKSPRCIKCGFEDMPRYSWNTTKVGIKHQSINQSINQSTLKLYLFTDHDGKKFLVIIRDSYFGGSSSILTHMKSSNIFFRDGKEIAVVYFRSGFSPSQYKSQHVRIMNWLCHC